MRRTALCITGPQDSRRTYPFIPTKFKITEGQPKYQPKPGKGPHCHRAPVSLPSPRKSDVPLTTMLAAMTSGSTQIDSTKKVYSKDGSREGRDRTTDMVRDLRFLPGLPVHPRPC